MNPKYYIWNRLLVSHTEGGKYDVNTFKSIYTALDHCGVHC